MKMKSAVDKNTLKTTTEKTNYKECKELKRVPVLLAFVSKYDQLLVWLKNRFIFIVQLHLGLPLSHP